MPHSAASNERRRALYREARLLGLSPRDAGHVYSRKTIDRVRSERTGLEPRTEGTRAERQEKHRLYLETKRGRPVTLDQSREDYIVHNYSTHYTKATLRIYDPDEDAIKVRHVTITSDRPLTRGELRDRAEAYVAKANRGIGGSGRPNDRLESVTFTGEVHYAEVNL